MTTKTPSFKKSMLRLNEIVGTLEKNDLELEEAIALFEEGLSLVQTCDGQLKNFENKVASLLESYQEDANHE